MTPSAESEDSGNAGGAASGDGEGSLGDSCDAATPCASGLVCGSSGIALALCTVACDLSHPVCPAGAFCSGVDADGSAAVCLPVCMSDSECHAAGASCNDAYLPDGGSGPEVCGS